MPTPVHPPSPKVDIPGVAHTMPLTAGEVLPPTVNQARRASVTSSVSTDVCGACCVLLSLL